MFSHSFIYLFLFTYLFIYLQFTLWSSSLCYMLSSLCDFGQFVASDSRSSSLFLCHLHSGLMNFSFFLD